MKAVASRRQLAALGAGLLSQWSVTLVLQSLAPLAPLFQADLGLSKAQVGLLTSAAITGAWMTALAGGMLTDRLGVRKVMSASLVVTGTLMLFIWFVGSLLQAMAVMFVVGLARGTSFSCSTKAILEWFPARARATAMGVKQLGMPIAGIFAGATLPVIGLAFGWRNALVVSAVLILLCGIVIAVVYREASSPSHDSTEVFDMRAALGEMLRNRPLLSLCFVGFCFHLVQVAGLSYLPLYFKEVALVSAIPDESSRIVAAGAYLAICQIGSASGRVFWGMLSDRWFHGRRMAVMAITGALAAGTSYIMGNLGTGSPLWLLAAVVLSFGVVAVGWNGVYNAAVSEIVARKYAATGVGLSMTITEIGSISAAPLFGFVVDLTSSFQTSWVLLGCISAVGTVVATMVTMRSLRARIA